MIGIIRSIVYKHSWTPIKGMSHHSKNHRLRSRQQSQGNQPMSMEYNGYRSLLKLTVSAPYVHRFSPSWDHLSVAGSKS